MKRLIAAIVLSATVLALTAGLSAASPGVVHELLRQPLASQPGTDVVAITVDYAPGDATPPHEHPGFVYAYVLEGSVVSQVDDESPKTYTAGEMWSESPGQHHMISRNASSSRSARLLVFLIVPHGKPLTTLLPHAQ